MPDTMPLPAAALRRQAVALRQPWPARMLGALLLGLSMLPVYRLLGARETGLAGAATVAAADAYFDLALAGLLLLVPLALAGGLFVPAAAAERGVRSTVALLARPRPRVFAAGAGAVAAACALVVSLFVLHGSPNHLDSLVQALHARFWAEGRIAGPADALAPAWMIQNSTFTEHGWVSQYPPGHVALLAAGFIVGAPWLVGPLLTGIAVAATARFAERMLPADVGGVRFGVVLLAISPFMAGLGASWMNHATAAALLALAALCLVRLREGGIGWAAAAGCALAWAFATRPLTALAIGSVLVFGVIGVKALRARAAIAPALAAGALPVLAGLLAYNAHFFGSPFRFGYDVTLGPAAGLGFGRDPWGNIYGPVEALGYTSSDVVIANVALLEAPLPAITAVALLLLLARRLSRGHAVLLGWALAPVAANALYWHHGLHMGPRMLHEAAPAWLVLCGVAFAAAFRGLPAGTRLHPRFSPRSAFVTAAAAALVLGATVLAPARVLAWSQPEGTGLKLGELAPANSIVFVHDGWRGRVAMQLAAAGMRLDSVELAIRLNPTCEAQALADAVAVGDWQRRDVLLAGMDFRARGRGLPDLAELAPGNRIVPGLGGGDAAACARQAHSDRFGTIDIAPLLWQAALPGSPDRRPLVVRDLGPVLNERVLSANPRRTPFLLVADGAGRPRLHEYTQGMDLLWNR